jgi:hypothetical protein
VLTILNQALTTKKQGDLTRAIEATEAANAQFQSDAEEVSLRACVCVKEMLMKIRSEEGFTRDNVGRKGWNVDSLSILCADELVLYFSSPPSLSLF